MLNVGEILAMRGYHFMFDKNYFARNGHGRRLGLRKKLTLA